MAKKKRRPKPKSVSVKKEIKMAAQKTWTGGLCTEILSKRRMLTTPDFLSLKLSPYQLVFTYGTTKWRERNGYALSDCVYLGNAITAVKDWVMYDEKEKDRPVAFKEKRDPLKGIALADTLGALRGEAYVVPSLHMLELDDIEGNGFVYQRGQHWVKLFDQDYKTHGGMKKPFVKAWIYTGIPEAFPDVLHRSSRFHDSTENHFYTWSSTKRELNTQTKDPMSIHDWTGYLEDSLNDQIPFDYDERTSHLIANAY